MIRSLWCLVGIAEQSWPDKCTFFFKISGLFQWTVHALSPAILGKCALWINTPHPQKTLSPYQMTVTEEDGETADNCWCCTLYSQPPSRHYQWKSIRARVMIWGGSPDIWGDMIWSYMRRLTCGQLLSSHPFLAWLAYHMTNLKISHITWPTWEIQ